jgi:hypothetical protein
MLTLSKSQDDKKERKKPHVFWTVGRRICQSRDIDAPPPVVCELGGGLDEM